jgi:hypothetical protein
MSVILSLSKDGGCDTGQTPSFDRLRMTDMYRRLYVIGLCS